MIMTPHILWKVVLAAFALTGPAMAGCASNADPCKIQSGTYNIKLPEGYSEKTPAVIFLHGYGGTGKAILRNKRVAPPILKRGYALIAPNALKHKGARATSWNFHPSFNRGRNEVEFLKDIIKDVAEKFNIDTNQILLAGFSIGGSMTSYIACNNPAPFAAFAPVSGSFWRPHPTTCNAPVKLFHTHGWSDKTVPLEGRKINSDFIQGDVFYALSLWRETNQCDQPRAEKISVEGTFMRRQWKSCNPDSALEFALFHGGHTVPKGWADMILNWFEQLPNKLAQN
jgi:polyhydroxybutyrate depolymerase